MFKLLRQDKGQGIIVQYALTFFLVVAVIVAMTAYVRRAVQGRIYDTRHFMFYTANEAFSDTSLNLYGNLLMAYEPYYANREFTRVIDRRETERTEGALGTSGIYKKEYDYDRSGLTGTSYQTSPREAP